MKRRKSARVVLVNDRDEVFMLRHTGPTRTYWVLPGGGVEPGESWEEAALREMWEETGIDGVTLGPLLWTRCARDHYNGEPILLDERYYLVRCGSRAATNVNQLEEERQTYTASCWWNIPAMRDTPEVLYPERLADLIASIIAGEPVTAPMTLPE